MLNKEIWDKVLRLDLQEVRKKYLQGKPFWWRVMRWFSTKTEKHFLDEVESHYRQFLYLAGTSTDNIIPWTQDVDDFWHAHILNTSKYADDCMNLFGRFINHNPNVPQGTTRHKKAFTTTRTKYRETFVPHRETLVSGSTVNDNANAFIPYMLFWDLSNNYQAHHNSDHPVKHHDLTDEVCPDRHSTHSAPVEYSTPAPESNRHEDSPVHDSSHHHDSTPSHHDSGSSYDGGSSYDSGSSGCSSGSDSGGSSGCSSGGGGCSS